MASKLGVTALYVPPTQESGNLPMTPGPPMIAATADFGDQYMASTWLLPASESCHSQKLIFLGEVWFLGFWG